MRKKKLGKRKVLGFYFFYWFIVLISGGLAWLIFYSTLLHPLGGITITTKGLFLLGFLCGLCGTVCYLLVWGLMAPLAKWALGKARHQPKGFLELLR